MVRNIQLAWLQCECCATTTALPAFLITISVADGRQQIVSTWDAADHV